MRLFVAIELPAVLRRRLAELIGGLRRALPPASWAKCEQLHLTLTFLGQTDENLVPALRQALSAAFGACVEPQLRTAGPGVFPSPGRARVLWLGVDGGAALLELQRRVVVAASAALGQKLEGRRYNPHLTLGRCRDPWPRPEVERFMAKATLAADFSASHGTLFASELSPGGARYTAMATFPMAVAP